MPSQSLVDYMDDDVVDILPPVHALTGCDITSKVGTKPAALKTENECGYELLSFFGNTELTDEIISNAEKSVLRRISDQNLRKFDDMRYELYLKKLNQVNLENFPPTISSMRQHILRAYLQSHLWLHTPFIGDISGEPLEYG